MPKQPRRDDGDGAVSVNRFEDGRVCITCVTDGKTQDVLIGDFNAWRLLALLSFMLGVKLPKSIVKEIEL